MCLLKPFCKILENNFYSVLTFWVQSMLLLSIIWRTRLSKQLYKCLRQFTSVLCVDIMSIVGCWHSFIISFARMNGLVNCSAFHRLLQPPIDSIVVQGKYCNTLKPVRNYTSKELNNSKGVTLNLDEQQLNDIIFILLLSFKSPMKGIIC